MLVKFLRGGLGSINYLLNERKAAGTARVIKGDENLTRAIIRSITYKQKTCFGVLSFQEKRDFLTEEQKLKIIKDFEYALLGEYMLERTNVLWVEHSDKDGRLELNFLVPKIDLKIGKSFNPYFAKYDQTRIDLIKKIINDEYGLSSPDDPAKEQTILSSKKNINHYKNLEELDQKLHDLVKQGSIKNRDHVIELLIQSGIEITRINKKGVTIILPNKKTKNRLKGGIYDADFTSTQRLGELSQSSSRRIREFYDRNTQTECRENRRKLEELIVKRDQFNKKDMLIRLQKTISLYYKDRAWIISLSVTIALILGIVIGWIISGMVLKEETAWTIPKQWRYSQPAADKTQREYYISIPKNKETIESKSKKFILMKME
jgi:mobilization protein